MNTEKATWLHRLPSLLRVRLEHRPALQKILFNTGWLFLAKVVRVGVMFLITVWMARYLGPAQFGLLNYAIALVALFGAIANLGLNGIVVRDLVRTPEATADVLGSGFVVKAVGGLLAFGTATLTVGFIRPGDGVARALVEILGFVMVFKSTEIVKYWFESQVRSKYPVLVETSALLLFAVANVVLILKHAPLIAFAWAVFGEGALVALGLLLIYLRCGGSFGAWRVSSEKAIELVKDSWPLILSGIAITISMRIDQLMLGQMKGIGDVGVYSAAVRLSEVWYFVPVAIVSSAFPFVIDAKKRSDALYYGRLQKLYDLMMLLALGLSTVMTFSADFVVDSLFGSGYMSAGPIVVVLSWASIFVFYGTAWTKWMLVEGRTKTIFLFQVNAAITNIVLNWFLIPRYGAMGAAIATLVSYAVGHTLLAAAMRSQHVALRMLLASLDIRRTFRELIVK